MTFDEWLETDEGVVRFGMELRPEYVFAAKAGWDAATKAEREACAQMCLDESNKQWAAFDLEKTDYLEGRADSADYLWNKMRSNTQ